MKDNDPNTPDSQPSRRSFKWRSPQFVALVAAVAVAAIAVPAWAKSDHGLDDQLTAVGGAGAVTLRADGVAGELPAGPPAGIGSRPEGIQVPPPPPGGADGAAPLPGQLFPLDDHQIEQISAALQHFVDCLNDHGVDVGDPQVDRFQIAIPVGDAQNGDAFQQAMDECGGPPELPPPPPQDEP